MSSLLRDSCCNLVRLILILFNLIIYLALYGLMGTVVPENNDLSLKVMQDDEVMQMV